ncbi:hypothetical protein FB45DRAFT_1052373 [Roridomyces roridus]|uniref:Uncharacterized protein n=1 Tax=Roridomyces roridus TaxID=1738132 RepID=A0AAD7FZS3_9AGAR|nr:hypothetical protein FB45DRAFT_1052373 [Roridomyces roridus]
MQPTLPRRSSRRQRAQEPTRQLNGWTVLAAASAQTNDLPPPYELQAPAVASAATPAVDDSVTLRFDVPAKDTGTVQTLNFGLGVPYSVGYAEICRVMGLDPLSAHLGYKWDNEGARAVVHSLANAGEWEHCLESGVGMTERARKRTVICKIQNVDPQFPATGKRKYGASSTRPEGDTPLSYTDHYRRLKEHLKCALHEGALCFVSPVDEHHHPVDLMHATLWAKQISLGNATLSSPPDCSLFEDFDLPAPKRVRSESPDSEAESSTCAASSIHVHINLGKLYGGGSSQRAPLATVTTIHADNTVSVSYPPVHVHTAGDEENSFHS